MYAEDLLFFGWGWSRRDGSWREERGREFPDVVVGRLRRCVVRSGEVERGRVVLLLLLRHDDRDEELLPGLVDVPLARLAAVDREGLDLPVRILIVLR